MAWFKRTRKGIQTNTKDKKDTPDGLWHKTPTGKTQKYLLRKKVNLID